MVMRGVRDISILQNRSIQKDEPLTEEEQFALRSELGGINVGFSNCDAGRVV